jgi:hypothetical protein
MHSSRIAVHRGWKITWGAAKEEIGGGSEAAKMLARPYRAPWKLG